MVQDDVMKLFAQLLRMYSIEFRQLVGGEITGPQLYLLEILNEFGPTKMSDIAERLQITVGAVTLQADRSINAGLIIRERSTTDRRVVLLSITDEGRELVSKARQMRKGIMKKHFDRLSSDELEQLGKLYQKMLGE